MEISLKNVGKIKEATIIIDGITVIAGENDTGKSTVSRALFLMLNSSYNVEEHIKREMERSIFATLFSLRRAGGFGNINRWMRKIMSNSEEYKNNPELLKAYLREESKSSDAKLIDKAVSEVLERLHISNEEIFVSYLQKNIDEEFHGQLQNIYMKEPSEIRINFNDVKMSLEADDGWLSWDGTFIGQDIDAIYMDNPMILDEMKYGRLYHEETGHQGYLKKCLFPEREWGTVIDEIVTAKKLGRVYAMISKACDGKIVVHGSECGYQKEQGDEILSVKNLSAGLKTFAILKALLLNGSIKRNSIILLDEPEIHLHPEWQLLLAELVVLLHKEFDIRILLNTHSHYFLDAIEVYSQKHGVADKCQYYLAELDGDFAIMRDVTKNTEEIYKKLARPLQQLENERYYNGS